MGTKKAGMLDTYSSAELIQIKAIYWRARISVMSAAAKTGFFQSGRHEEKLAFGLREWHLGELIQAMHTQSVEQTESRLSAENAVLKVELAALTAYVNGGVTYA